MTARSSSIGPSAGGHGRVRVEVPSAVFLIAVPARTTPVLKVAFGSADHASLVAAAYRKSVSETHIMVWTGRAPAEWMGVSAARPHGLGFLLLALFANSLRCNRASVGHTCIVRVPCRFGGSRAYFMCPGNGNGVECGRRVAKLHQLTRYFLCRHCNRLMYTSQNESQWELAIRRANKMNSAPRQRCRYVCSASGKAQGYVAAHISEFCLRKRWRPRCWPTKPV